MEEQLQKIWQQTLALMEAELAKPSFDTWLSGTRPTALQGDTLVVEVPNDFTRDWIETRYINLVQKSLTTVVGEPWAVRFLTPDQIKDQTKPAPAPTRPDQEHRSAPEDTMGATMLNPRYTFDTFVIGNSNRFAHAASLAVAEAPAKAYNPLFIYGGVGLGKTHLMHAIGHYVASLYPFSKVMYVTSERFTNDLINSIRDDRTTEFRNRYRNIDVLLVDDIQFLAGKERTQEEFFHTFNALYEANKQIVLSSDRPPREIPTLESRLRSRFEWGLITDIQAPDLETRVAILRKKASVERLELPNDVMLFIAKHIHSNIRELEGALIRVVAYASLTNQQVTPEVAQEALKDIVAGNRQKKITIDLIQNVVARYFGLRAEDLRDKKRTRTISFPRQVAMYLSRELTDASLPKIGDAFGGRDHTTVIHAYEKIQDGLKEDPSLSDCLEAIIQQLQTG